MLECQKRAIKKYMDKNRDKINEYNRIRYNKLKEENGEKYQQILNSKRANYHKRKAKQELENSEILELNEIKENENINLQ